MKKAIVLAGCLSGLLLAAGPLSAAVVAVPVAPAPAPAPEEVANILHATAMAWYGVVNMLGMAVVVWVRRQMRRAIPRCLMIGAVGGLCWIVGLFGGFTWLTVAGVVLLCLAHVCECTFHFRRLLRRSYRGLNRGE